MLRELFKEYIDFFTPAKTDPEPLVGDIGYRFGMGAVAYVLGIVLALSIATGAWAAEHVHEGHPEDMAMHEKFYSKWNKPNVRDDKGERTASCCNKQDCYPTSIRFKDGDYYAQRREDHRWLLIPASLLEQNYMDPRNSAGDGRESPDGQSHVCMSKPYGSVAYEYGGTPVDIVPTKAAFEITTDGTVYCATIGGGT